MVDQAMSRAEFSRLMEHALSEVDAGLREARASRHSCAQIFTVHDWWEHLTEVVMPELLLQLSGRP